MADDDPFASIATPVKQAEDPFASIAKPIADTSDPTASDIINGPTGVPDTGWRGQIEKFGQGAAQAITAPFTHPIKTAEGMLESTPIGMAYDAVTGKPNVGQQMGTNAVQNPANVLGQAAGGLALSHVLPAAAGVADAVRGVGDWWKPTTSPAVVPQTEQAGAALARSISPTTQIAPGDEEAITAQTPGIKEFAKRTNNPLNTPWEYAKAAEGHGAEYRQLWQEKILGPEQDFSVEVAPDRKMSLGQIDNRISDINADLRNDYLRPNEAKQFNSEQTRALKAEAASLNEVLAQSLADKTGLAPAELKQIRMAYGQSRAVDQFTDLARRQPSTAPGGIPHTKTGVVSALAEKAQGGRTSIVARAYQDALAKPGLEAAQSSPLPDYATRLTQHRASLAQQAAENQAAAQQEVLKGHELDTGAQEASGSRAQQATEARGENKAQDAQRYIGSETHDFDIGAWKRDHPDAPQTQLDAVRARLAKNGFTVRE